MAFAQDTGSLVNHLYSRMTVGQPDPAVGMGATILCHTDRKAATIIEVDTSKSATVLVVQWDKANRTDDNGMSEDQEYAFEANPEGPTAKFRKTKSGSWEEVYLNPATKRLVKTGGGHGLRVGERRHYHDFSF